MTIAGAQMKYPLWLLLAACVSGANAAEPSAARREGIVVDLNAEASRLAQNDLARATDIARSMVKQYGMSEKLGHMTFEQERKPLFLDITPGSGAKEYSEETAREIDNEVKAIIEHSYTKVKDTLTKKRDLLELVARTLLEKESIDGEELRNMLKEHAEGDHDNESR